MIRTKKKNKKKKYKKPLDIISNLQPHFSTNPVSRWSHKKSHKLWGDKDDYTYRNIKRKMVGDNDFQRVTNSYVNGSSIDKGNFN
jgi:hypothetical protein